MMVRRPKTRFVDASYMRKLFEVYTFEDRFIASDLEQILATIAEKAGGFDVVIVTDLDTG